MDGKIIFSGQERKIDAQLFLKLVKADIFDEVGELLEGSGSLGKVSR